MQMSVTEKRWLYKGLPCYVVLNYWGNRCGYVDVTGTSFEQYANQNNYSEAPIDVHGGITYGGEAIGQGIESFHGKLLGWDYAHYIDAKVPVDEMLIRFENYPETIKYIKESAERGNYSSSYGGEWYTSMFDVARDCESVVNQIIQKEHENVLNAQSLSAKREGEVR